MGGLVHALDVADVVREWTPEGKKLCRRAERSCRLTTRWSSSRLARSSWGATGR